MLMNFLYRIKSVGDWQTDRGRQRRRDASVFSRAGGNCRSSRITTHQPAVRLAETASGVLEYSDDDDAEFVRYSICHIEPV